MFRFDDVFFPAIPMLKHLPRICLVALFLGTAAHTEPPGKVDLEAAEMAAELIGGPVYAKDGVEVGTVADIALDEELQPHRLHMTTGKDLGFGTRTLDVPKGAFMLVRGAVILRVPAGAVSAFSELAEPTDEK
jgi:sporulation protein YlmC with PRC-barrel domain